MENSHISLRSASNLRSRLVSGVSTFDSSMEEAQNAINVKKRVHRNIIVEGTSSSSDEVFSETKQSSKPNARKSTMTRHKTSDYSSEEGEELQNTSVNGDSFHNLNGSGSFQGAYKIYKEAGEYWNKYPKTDYTYSRYSLDRREIAPGVIAMPNMSRRSLRSGQEAVISPVNLNRQEQYDLYVRSRKYLSNKSENRYQQRTFEKFVGQDETDLYDETLIFKILRITRLLLIYTSIASWISSGISWTTSHFRTNDKTFRRRSLYFPTHLQESKWYNRLWSSVIYGICRVGSLFYTALCYVLLLDTWLLIRRDASKKMSTRTILALALIPPLLIGGLYLVTKYDGKLPQIAYPNITLTLPPISEYAHRSQVALLDVFEYTKIATNEYYKAMCDFVRNNLPQST